MVTATSTDITREHYQRPEVRGTIRRYCLGEDVFRALNGGEGWYKQASWPGKVRLTTPDDYDIIIGKHRTLYATIDFLDESVKGISQPWNVEKGAPQAPIGTLADCRAYTLSVDIDSIKGPNGENITSSPEIKAAVEAAGQFFVDYLHEHDISKSIHCLYSGGGIYVHIHHALTIAGQDWTPDNCKHVFQRLGIAYNFLIAKVEKKFFEANPEHKRRIKFDKLNNQKRKFKVIFSIHKKFPFAVIPLDTDHIEIDFTRARIPLSDQVLAKGSRWYQSYVIYVKRMHSRPS